MRNSERRCAMTQFTVQGPFKVPFEKRRLAKMICPGCRPFWRLHEGLASQRGCYVFAIRAGKGYRPIYVGRTTKGTFAEECFTNHKTGRHYNPALLNTRKGSPVMFFLTYPKPKGQKSISNLEKFLIQIAVARNPDLSNVVGTAKHTWGIRGVIRGGKGKPSCAACEFTRLMGL